ncbi:hypothetical protein SMAC4_13993 [Sordaria macrospora]|uniref:uncharacterized protein n=1 Tax=Sordaria macrospora TaxID=5147 RepID=UPI002B2828BD|nr:hypothetical protein SMAC4_13993 [Sordaria macrospora]
MHDGQGFGIPEENVRQDVVAIGCFASGVPRYRCCITVLQAARKQDSCSTSSEEESIPWEHEHPQGGAVVQIGGVGRQAGGISKPNPAAEPHRAHDSTMTACLRNLAGFRIDQSTSGWLSADRRIDHQDSHPESRYLLTAVSGRLSTSAKNYRTWVSCGTSTS